MSRPRPDVSVVIPNGGRSDQFAEAAASALGQVDVEVEIIVVQDGPAPEAPPAEVIDDPRVTVVPSEGRLGPAACRNEGIRRATGAWIALLDDDDLWAADKLRRQLDAADEAGATWAYAGEAVFQVVDGERVVLGRNGTHPAEHVRRRMPFKNLAALSCSNVVGRADAVRDAGPFDTSLPHLEDWDFLIRLSCTGAGAGVDSPLVAKRINRSQRSMRRIQATLDAYRTIDARYAVLRDNRPIDWRAAYRYLAWLETRAGRPRAATADYLRAVRHGDVTSLARLAAIWAVPALRNGGVASRPRRQEDHPDLHWLTRRS